MVAIRTEIDVPADIQRQLLAVEMIPVEQLMVDHKFQRDSDVSRQNKMAKDWNWMACGHLAVSLRVRGSGRRARNVYSVIDGQQRLGAIRQLGFKTAPCHVYVDLTEQQEAELYELLNNGKKPTFNDLFKSRLVRNEEVAIQIQLAVRSSGYELDPERAHKGVKYIQTMAELERIYKQGKTGLIMDTLRFLKDIWGTEHLGHQQMIIAGISTFMERYGREVSLDQMKDKMRRIGQLKMTQNAFQYAAARGNSGGSNSRGNAFSEAMLMLYNQNRQESNRVKSKF